MTHPVPVMRLDPHAHLDFAVDWAPWLYDGDTISSVEWIAEPGLTIEDGGRDGPIATVWVQVADGVPVGSTLRVTCRATTADGRIDDQSIRFAILDA